MKRILLSIIALILLSTKIYLIRLRTQERTPAQQAWPEAGAMPSVPPSDLVVESDNSKLQKELGRKVNPLIAAQNFQELDKLADELRNSKAQTASGKWQLRVFYELITSLPEEASEAECQARVDFCSKWAAARVDSIAARVAWGTVYKNFAWQARGSGYANTVTQTGWKLYADRLRRARGILTEARNLKTRCPVWWDTMLIIALGEQCDARAYNQTFNEAIAFEPSYAYYYFHKAIYLLPRWYGKEGDWQKFATDASDKLGGEAGDILYARIGWWVHFQRVYDAFVPEARYSFERLTHGMDLLSKQYPDSVSARSELAYLFCLLGDPQSARPLFVQIGNRYDDDVWGSKDRFLRGKTWAQTAVTAVVRPVKGAGPGPGQAKELVVLQPDGTPLPDPPYVQNIELKGISGPPTRRLALINDQTLAVGETAGVKVGAQKVKVTCLEIRDRSVLVLLPGVAKPKEIALK